MSETTVQTDWLEANQRDLCDALSRIRAALERHVDTVEGAGAELNCAPPLMNRDPAGRWPAVESRNGDDRSTAEPATLISLSRLFGLSLFERDVLLLCAGVELDGSLAGLCARASGDSHRAYPTFSLALAALPNAHWSAIAPGGALRFWRLVELDPGRSIVDGRLRIDERVLHFLAGIHHLDDELRGYIRPVDPPTHLVPSHRALAERAASVWRHAADGASIPVLQFCGGDPATTHAIAVAAAANLDLRVLMIDALALPNSPADCETLRLLAVREAMLSGSVLLLNGYAADRSDSARDVLITRFAESSGCPLMIVGEERRRLPLRSIVTFDVAPPTFGERLDVWLAALGGFGGEIDPDLRRLATQFDLPPNAIRAACDREAAMCKHGAAPGDDRLDFGDRLWDACRIEARPRLDDLAQRIETDASWDDLVLPEKEKETLRDIATHVRCQSTVYEDWGFGESSPRGLGISALFAGASGTGKTLAAEVLANELRLDLYRIDLSRVVSKYIGETEKNLSRVFDAAERGGAVLLFDEADALFGKRSEVKDSHDRYANIEVSYLLQRMEAYRGLAILTTNMKSALDGAFLRRIRFIIRFPFPEPAQRAEIWRRIFPADTPTAGLDPQRLAQLDIAGGTIRNIALNAAVLAADGGGPVRMHHLLAAARREYTKLEKSLTDVETRGWT